MVQCSAAVDAENGLKHGVHARSLCSTSLYVVGPGSPRWGPGIHGARYQADLGAADDFNARAVCGRQGQLSAADLSDNSDKQSAIPSRKPLHMSGCRWSHSHQLLRLYICIATAWTFCFDGSSLHASRALPTLKGTAYHQSGNVPAI
eukprot:s1926_g9.t1